MSLLFSCQHRWLVPFLPVLLIVCAGCSQLNRNLLAQSSLASPAPKQYDAQRVSYVEERYREFPDDSKKTSNNPLDALSSKNLKANFKKATGRGRDPKAARQLFVDAETEYQAATQAQGDDRKAKFAAAGAKYFEASERWPDSPLEEDALFMAGECYFFADQFPKANENYELLVKQHPNTRHIDQVDAHRFAIAKYWLDLDQVKHEAFYELNLIDKKKPTYDTDGHAFRIFDRIRIDDPTGKLSDDATLAAANAHFAAGRYLKADDLYTDLRKTYPNSEHQFLAHFLGLKAKLNSYQGADYGGDTLDEAEKLVKQIRKLFPAQAEKEKEYLARAFAEVRFKKAERLWSMGRYHEIRYEYGAASHYYQQIIENYGDTKFADEARQHLADNAGKPASPAQPLMWLSDLFPKRQPSKPLISTDDPINAKSSKR